MPITYAFSLSTIQYPWMLCLCFLQTFPLMGWSLSSSILPCCPVILLSPSFNLLIRLSMEFLSFISSVSVFSPQVFLSPYWICFHILRLLSHLIQLLVWVLLEPYRCFLWLLCLEFYLLHFYLEEIAEGIVTSRGVLLPFFFLHVFCIFAFRLVHMGKGGYLDFCCSCFNHHWKCLKCSRVAKFIRA